MNTFTKFIGIIALSAVIVFSMATCGGDDDDDGGNNGGVKWTAVSNSTFGDVYDNIYGIAWGNNKFVAVGTRGRMAYSSDGVTWTAVTDSTFGSYDNISGIAWGNNKFIAVGGVGSQDKMAYSSDGITWTVVNTTFNHYLFNIVWGGTAGNEKFVVTGWDNSGGTSRGNKMAYSPDGMTWTAITDTKIYYDDNISGIAWGNDKFVAVSQGGKAAYSSDGITWTAATTGVTFDGRAMLLDIAWGNDKFVAMGQSGKMATSPDGVTWTAVADSTFGNYAEINGIAYGSNGGAVNTFVAGGGEGKMATSPDGVTWTAVADSAFGDRVIRAIAWGNDKFVAGGQSGKMAYWDGK